MVARVKTDLRYPDRWRRLFAGSGPVDFFDGRYRIVRSGSGSWKVTDTVTGETVSVRHPSAVIARHWVEEHLA